MNTLLTITGPSCSGKSTLESKLRNEYGLNRIVSFTTRSPRVGESNGVDYWFISEKEVKEKIEKDEVAECIHFNDNYYGILWHELARKITSKPCAVVVEPNGAKQLSLYCKARNITHKSVYLTNHPNVLISRFLKRYKEDEKADIFYYSQRIVETVTKEQNWIYEFNYDKIFTSFDSSNERAIITEIYEDLIL